MCPFTGFIKPVNPVAACLLIESASGQQHRICSITKLQANPNRLPPAYPIRYSTGKVHVHLETAILDNRKHTADHQVISFASKCKAAFKTRNNPGEIKLVDIYPDFISLELINLPEPLALADGLTLIQLDG